LPDLAAPNMKVATADHPTRLRYCRRCVYPETKPGIRFDAEDICSGCRAQERKRSVDWSARLEELRALCARCRSDDGGYDCVVPISGGKDSHLQVYYMKEILGMHPLCVHVAPQTTTALGAANLQNLQDRFGVDIVTLRLNPATECRITRHWMATRAWPNWGHDKAIYAWPAQVAINFGVRLLVMGENHDYESGGKDTGDGAAAASQMLHSLDGEPDSTAWAAAGVHKSEIAPYLSPSPEALDDAGLNVIWLGYYVNWDGFGVYLRARDLGFRPLDRTPEGLIDTYCGIDDPVVQVNGWLKFIKFGFARVSDVAFNHISYDRMTRARAVELVNAHEGRLDPVFKRAWLDYTGVDETSFDAIVDRFANRDVVAFTDGRWRLKQPVR